MIKTKRHAVRNATVLLCAVLLVICFSRQAFAASEIQTDKKGSLTVSELYDEKGAVKPIADVELEVWRVARVTSGAKFVPVDGFADAAVEINKLSAAAWKDAADALLAYTKANSTKVGTPLKMKTNTGGEALLSNLETGLYLIAPVKSEIRVPGYTAYLQKAMLVSLPNQADASSAWDYEVKVTPKNEVKPYSPPPALTSYTVQKIWKDENNASGKRPAQIYVRLLQNGNPYVGSDSTVLLQEGSWSHTWKFLPMGYQYTVEEVYVPEGYVSSVSGNTITNVLKPQDPEDPKEPKDPGRDGEGKFPNKPKDRDSEEKTPKRPDNPPKTGDERNPLLWILLCAGAAGGLCMAAWRKKKR